MKYITLLLVVISISFKVEAQQYKKIHSHNDYKQNVPFWTAVSAEVDAIETDVFLKHGNLFVAHESFEIDKGKTLKSLYLEPLKVAIKLGFVANKKPLQLLIDIKTEAYKTLEKLVEQLQNYPTITNNKKIKIVISGTRPKPEDYVKYPQFIYFDYQSKEFPKSSLIASKIALISYSFKDFSVWNGKGKIVKAENDAIKKTIEKVHAFNKPIRFWATPDSKSSWKALSDLGVDFINTDQPHKCAKYFKSLPKRWVKSTIFSEVYYPLFKSDKKKSEVKNIILMIGDGNGLTQISSAVLANGGQLTLTQLKSMGLMKTQSADDFTTDSAASGSAIATGHKTYNRAIGVDSNGNSVKNIVEILNRYNYVSGCVTTDEIFGATPSAFFAHQKDRGFEDEIAKELLNSKLSLFVGGGSKKYTSKELKNNGFLMVNKVDEIGKSTADKIGYFISKGGVPSVKEGRGNILATITKKSIEFLESKSKPFFLMVEAAQIDNYGHHNDMYGVITETIDFDRAITEAIKYADTREDTLVIILADHETGGLTIPQGNTSTNHIEGAFSTHDHTGVLIPVFAYGPKSYEFEGCYENNDIFHKILNVLNVKNER